MCHVLIIEDEPFVTMHIEALLGDVGAKSFASVVTEEEAVAEALASPPGLITSDVKLLAGHGPAAVQRIIALLGPVPVIFITGTPNDCSPCDPSALVLTKPVSGEALAKAYHSLIDSSGCARSLI